MSHQKSLDHYRHLIIYKVAANLRSEASRNYLSYLWWVFEPLMQMMVYYFVFGLMLLQGTDNFVAFLLTGLMALIIVIIAVSSQAIKASLTDPVKSLRYE